MKPRETIYAVTMHVPNRNGYVVRPVYHTTDGQITLPRPYAASDIVKTYKRHHAAQAYADRRNHEEGYL